MRSKKHLAEVKKLQKAAGILREWPEDKEWDETPDSDEGPQENTGIASEIDDEYAAGGSILSFANPRDLPRIAEVSPRAAKALEALNNMLPDDTEIEDLPSRLRSKAQALELGILKELGIDPTNLDETEVESSKQDSLADQMLDGIGLPYDEGSMAEKFRVVAKSLGMKEARARNSRDLQATIPGDYSFGYERGDDPETAYPSFISIQNPRMQKDPTIRSLVAKCIEAYD